MIKQLVELQEDVLRLHTLFLEKVEILTDQEREAFVVYFNQLNQPPVVVDESLLEQVDAELGGRK